MPSNGVDGRTGDAAEVGSGGAGGGAASGPIAALTFEAARDALFDQLAGAYKFLEPKGVNSRLPGRYTRWQSGQDPELITRTMEALGSWLSRPNRPAEVMTPRGPVNVEEIMVRALANGSDPASGVTWQTMERGQLDVESSHIAWGSYVAGDRVLNKLTAAQRTNLQNWLFNHTFADVMQNWSLFYVVTNAFLKSKGWRHDATGMATLLNRSFNFYKGNGWYTDGATNVFDDYNSTVFSTHFAEWAIMSGNDDPVRRREVLMRLRRYNEDQPYFYAKQGMHPEFGRSTSYKMARLTGLILSYHIDQSYGATWNLGFKVVPDELTRGMLRRLIREHLNYYLRNGTDNPATGVLGQRLTGTGSMEIAEDYISPGSVYWASRALGALMLLADDDPFWSASEEPLPIEKADYNRWLATPGWLLTGNRDNGSVQLFNAGTTYSAAHIPSYVLKYAKFVYSSQFGFIVSNDSLNWRNPDNAIQINAGSQWGHRLNPGTFASQSATANSAVVAMKHRQSSGTAQFDVRTLVFVKNDFHVRVNQITPVGFTGTYRVREGGFAVGRETAGGMITQDPGTKWAYATGAEGAAMVGALRTYDRVERDLPAGEKREGTNTAHTRHAYYALPYAITSMPVSGETTVALLVRGT
ncbi:MAG TPA: DUF2264 domain-containing protein, partial [Polyangia bacterium]